MNTERKIVFVARKETSLIKLDADHLSIMAMETFVAKLVCMIGLTNTLNVH